MTTWNGLKLGGLVVMAAAVSACGGAARTEKIQTVGAGGGTILLAESDNGFDGAGHT
jgi:hypothetical protein